MKRKAERGTKLLNIFKSIFFITFVINIFLFAYKHESKVEHSNYKILVQETEGSSNYVEYSGISFPKSGYVLAGSTCKNGGVITQTAAKTLSFTGGVDECTLKFDIAGETYTENSLYGVIANEYNNGGLAGKYTGDHADAYDRSGTEDIYYFTTPIENDETQGNELLDKWNVIFGGFCWQMLRTTDTGGVKMIYNGVPSNGTCNNSGEAQQIGKSAFNSNYNSPAYVGYMYNTVYEYQTRTAGAYKYGNSFTYSNGTYTLTDTITTSSNATASDLNNHHYTCFNTSGTCSSISYIYYWSSSTAYYITLSNGKSVENALNEMLSNSNVNTNNSTIKTYIDNWYQNNLSSYTSYLEDSVFCNDRSIRSLNGWNPNGGSVNSELYFKEYTSTSDLSCTNDTDRFSTLNNSARLTYPIGLASNPEMNLLNNSTSRNTGQYYRLASPSNFGNDCAFGRSVNTTGGLSYHYVTVTFGARPVISLKPGTEYLYGDGSKNNPYIIDTSPSTMSFDKLKSLNSSISLNSTTPNFGETAIEDEGIFKADDDYGTSYYWRGAATTNYIQFGKNSSNQDLYWRIIRINGDGSLRLLYDGTSPGQASSIGTNVYNNASGRKVYIGYMHSGMGISSNTNTNSSAVKQVIDSWYENNIKNKSFESNISDNLFCNDRSESSSNLPNLGPSGYYTYFSAYDRIYHNNPILTCPQKNDAFTVSDTTFGNGNLTYPIGLISADEYQMTSLYSSGNKHYSWTMSPKAFCEEGMNVVSQHVWQYLLSNNQLNSLENTSSANISPVINLKSSVINSITGKGTSTDPFVVH